MLLPELKQRRDKIRVLMAQQGIDAALFTCNVNLIYTYGQVVSGFLYLPLNDSARLFIKRPNNIEGEHIRPIRKPELLPDLLTEQGLPLPQRLMLEGDELSFNEYRRLAACFPSAEVLPCGSALVRQARSVKTKLEIELFRRQLALADKADKPVIIHNREAGEDIFDILKTHLPSKGAVLHCYSEDAAYAKKILDMNVMFSFAGNLTYKNARNLHETVKILPPERILLESEAPFMVPSVYRGKRNRPSYLKETLKFLARLLDRNEEDLAEIIYQNSLRFFGITE